MKVSRIRRIRKGVLLMLASGFLALGCELIVDFDRTRIPVEGADSAIDAQAADVAADTSTADTGADANVEAEASVEAGDDAGDGGDAADGDADQ